MEFNFDGVEHRIGSELFPLRSILAANIFTADTTEPFNHEDFNKIIDNNEFDIGHCYSNSEKIRLIGEKLGVEAVYYAGWLFMRNQIPIHHAWCVIDNKHVVDMGYSERGLRFLEKIIGDPNWRERFADNVIFRTQSIRRSKDCIMGQAPKGAVYIGCPDDMESARKTFRDLIKRNPNHPSYAHKGMNAHGASTVQKIIKDRQ